MSCMTIFFINKCKSADQTSGHTQSGLSAWWFCIWSLQYSSRVCVGIYGLTYSLLSPQRGAHRRVIKRNDTHTCKCLIFALLSAFFHSDMMLHVVVYVNRWAICMGHGIAQQHVYMCIYQWKAFCAFAETFLNNNSTWKGLQQWVIIKGTKPPFLL